MRSAPHGRRALLLSHSHVFGTFRVGSHHYAREFARSGDEVVHLSTPVSLAHRLTGRVDRASASAVPRRPHRDSDGVTHVVPRTLLPRPVGPFTVARELERHGIDPRFDAVLLDQPLLWDGTVRSLAPRLVYRPTDLYPSGVKAEIQSRIVLSADAVVATTSEVLSSLGPLDVPALVLGNGVDARRFTSAAAPAPRRDVCVYVGALDSRFDWAQVAAWAASHPTIGFEIAGPGSAPPDLPDNVRVLGPVAYDHLPALLQSARVGLLPLSDDPSNAGRSPMKLYEYLAAGLAVVARSTPVLTPDPAVGIFTYDALADADAALDAALDTDSPNRAGAAAAQAQSWGAKARALSDFIAVVPTR